MSIIEYIYCYEIEWLIINLIYKSIYLLLYSLYIIVYTYMQIHLVYVKQNIDVTQIINQIAANSCIVSKSIIQVNVYV